MNSLQQNILDEAKSRLIKEFQPEQIFLFGSYVWGKPGDDSDIDLLVVVKESNLKPVQRAERAYRCLRGLTVQIDVFVKTKAEVELHQQVFASLVSEIIEKGIKLYG